MTTPTQESGEAAPLDPKDAEIRRLQRELDHFTKSGIIEVAVRNPSVSEYMDHWEGRALKAEAALRPAGDAGEPVVKALEWGMYRALGGGLKLVALDCFRNEFARLDIKDHTDAEIAAFKAQKQAHYAEAIRSALAAPVRSPDAGAAKFTSDDLRKLAKEKGWYVRENTSVPDIYNGGWKHPFSVTLGDSDLLDLIASRAALSSPQPPAVVGRVTDEMVEAALFAFDDGIGDPNDYRRRMGKALKAAFALSTALASARPEGWRLVPVEPTEAMAVAMRRWENPILAWEAALAAAPVPAEEAMP